MIDNLRIKNAILEEKLLFKMKQATYYKKKYQKAQSIIKELEKYKYSADELNEIERLNNIIEDIDTYIHLWKLDDIGEKTMLILNDILLIKNGMRNEVVRLKENK